MQEEQSTFLARLAMKPCNDTKALPLQSETTLDEHAATVDYTSCRRPRDLTSYRQYTDPTLFDLVILPNNGTEITTYPARGKMDCAGDTNVASLELVMAAGLGPQLQDVTSEVSFQMLNGISFSPEKQITVSWRLPNDRKTRATHFYVAAQSPYQLLFGQDWMESSHDVFKHQPALLPIVGKRVKPAKRREMNDAHQSQLAAAKAEAAEEQASYSYTMQRACLPPSSRSEDNDAVPGAHLNQSEQNNPRSTRRETLGMTMPNRKRPLDELPASAALASATTAVASASTQYGDRTQTSAEATAVGSSSTSDEPDTPSTIISTSTLRPPMLVRLPALHPEDSATTSVAEDSIGRRSTPDRSRVSHGTSTDITPASSSDIQRVAAVPGIRAADTGDSMPPANHPLDDDEAPRGQKGFKAIMRRVFKVAGH
ncbi:hypothetical protein LTR65_003068 [Meristemomyces frigidus]